MKSSFARRRVFITGGSSGIGKAIARELVCGEADVIICGRDVHKLAASEAELARAARGAGRVRALRLDVTDEQAVSRAADQVLTTLGGLDLLINNAGSAHPAAAHDTNLTVYREMMAVNYFGAVHVTKAFLGHFQAQRAGQIGAVLSVLGFMGVHGYSAYAASKYALHGFFDCLRQELLGHGVGVSLLFPGDTDTPQLAAENVIKPEATRLLSSHVPVLQPDYVARAFLAGLARRQYHIVPSLPAKCTYYAQRHAPGLVRAWIDRELSKLVRRVGKPRSEAIGMPEERVRGREQGLEHRE